MEIEFIEKLAELVAKQDLDEITIVEGDNRVTVKGKKCPPPPHHPPMPPHHPMPPEREPSEHHTIPQHSDHSNDAPVSTEKVIKSPIVGTFYAAPSPEQKPFVQVGDHVKKGDTIMIIESMKLMNEVQSDQDGVVQKILVKNGDAVEYDQPLMILQ